MSDETRMEAIVPADRAWTVSPMGKRGVCWSRLAGGDVVGLVMRKIDLVRADSQPGLSAIWTK